MRDQFGTEPDALARRPVLYPYASYYLNVFNVLSATRSYGFDGPLPIQLTEIEAFLRMFPDADPVFLLHVILGVDRHYLVKVREKHRE